MGNTLTRRRHLVDERYTKPQGLYQHRDVDHKKLRKLIMDAKLAPCYPGSEDSTANLDECPICFLYYPSLNRSRCCVKGICTECFLQMKSPHSARPAQCPFCKTPNYAVEYRGAKTPEEKGIEQAEEQKVIEAKIRMRQEELQAEERVHARQQEICPSQTLSPSNEVERQDLTDLREIAAAESSSTLLPGGEHATHALYSTAASVQNQGAIGSQILHGHHNRNEEFDLDLEEIMVMEAIWLSIQEHGLQRISVSTPSGSGNILASGHSYHRPDQEVGSESTMSTTILGDSRELIPRSSVTGGLASAIATLAERNAFNADSSVANQNVENYQATFDPGENRVKEGHSTTNMQDLSASIIHERSCGISAIEEHGQRIKTEEYKKDTEQERERAPALYAPEHLSDLSPQHRRAACLKEGSQGSISDWTPAHSSEAVDVGTSFSSSIPSASDLPWEAAPDVHVNAEIPADLASFSVHPSVVPATFEEQMMLAMALSIATAQAGS